MQIRQNRRDFLASASLAAAAGVLIVDYLFLAPRFNFGTEGKIFQRAGQI